MIELAGITWDHPRGYGPLEASQGIYEQAHGVRIRWDKRSLKDFGDAALAELALDYDLIVLDHPHMGVAANQSCIQPLDTLLSGETLAQLAAQTAGPSFGSYHYAGHQWALPLDAACQVSVHRADLLGGHPLPDKWDSVFKLAEALRSGGLHIGLALCPTDTLCSFLTICAQLGDGPVEGRGKFVSLETGLQALEILCRLRDVCHPDSVRWNPIALCDNMARADNRIAYAPLAFGYSNYARPGYAEKRLAFGGIPGRTQALLGGAGIAISARCRKSRAAACYLQWLCAEAYQKTGYTEKGGQPGNGVAWKDAAANKAAGGFLSQTLDTLEQAYMRPRHAGWPPFQEFLGDRVHQFLTQNNESPKTVLQDLQKRYDETLTI